MNIAEKKYQGTVLRVDDALHSIDILLTYLNKRGLKVLDAQDGNEGIEIAKQAKPDVILLDFMMPEMNGFEVYQILQAEETTKDIPVIFMFSMDIIEDEIFPKEILEMEYVIKPFVMEKVWKCVKKHLPGE